jgi:hypothetical protein
MGCYLPGGRIRIYAAASRRKVASGKGGLPGLSGFGKSKRPLLRRHVDFYQTRIIVPSFCREPLLVGAPGDTS